MVWLQGAGPVYRVITARAVSQVLRKANSKLALSELESCSDINQLKEACDQLICFANS